MCPFCSTTLPSDRIAQAIPGAPRLSRAAAFAFASTLTAMGASAVGCSDDTGGSTVVDSGAQQAAYGAPVDATPPSDTGSEAATDSATAPDTGADAAADADTGSMAGAYGLPPSDGG